jgi:hypothetical protein
MKTFPCLKAMLCTGLITHTFNYLHVAKANILTSFKHFAGSIVIRMFIPIFHYFTVHFDSLSFLTPTYALSHTTMY